jgi:hypothetical protein
MKLHLNYLFFSFLFANIALAQTNLSNGLIIDMPFDANTKDTSGNQFHGQNNGAILVADRCGHPNSAFSFNGVDAYIELPYKPLLNNAYSFSMWLNAEVLPAAGNYVYPFAIGGTGGGQNIALCNNAMQGWSGGAYNNGNPTVSLVSAGIMPNTNQWYHVVLTRDSIKIKLYIDGVLNTNEVNYGNWNTNVGNTLPNYGNSGIATIGGRDLNPNFYFKGAIDDVKIYDRPLTAEEVVALYNEKNCLNIQNLSTHTQINLYPNPAQQVITIELADLEEVKSYSIIDALGKVVKNASISANGQLLNIQLSELAAGIYEIQLRSNKTIYRKQFSIVN